MLLKYIEVEIKHNKKKYKFTNNELRFDSNVDDILIINEEYVMKDIFKYECKIYTLFNNLIKIGAYYSISNIKRALRSGSLSVIISITYCDNINKKIYPWGYSKDVKTKEDARKYCSGIRYYYDFNTNKLDRYELYGDLILGDEIPRDESYYKN